MADGQRKLAAIVAADVAGYSRLVAADEEGTVSRLRALRRELFEPAIAAHRGRVANTAGDSLLVEFLSAVDAVRCALEVQHEMARRNGDIAADRRIELRVGIHIGDVIEDGGDLLGDEVNVAARLEALAAPGGLALSASAHAHAAGKVEAVFVDDGMREVKNMAPLRVWRWSPDGAATAAEAAQQAAAQVSQKPAIAVLPFVNRSSDPEQEYFADGLTEDVSIALSRFREFATIAHGSSIAFKNTDEPRSAVARQLGARYLVEGSVRNAGNRVRVTASLVDAADGNQLWGERYDRELSDIFALQDELGVAIVSAIAPRSIEAETRRSSKLTQTQLGAWDLLLRARPLLATRSKAGNRAARDLLQKATELDPDNAQAHAWLAAALSSGAALHYVDDVQAAREACFVAAQTAVALDPDDAFVRTQSGISWALIRNDLQRGIDETLTAVQLNPNLANAHGGLCALLAVRGDLAMAREHLAAARRLSPRDPEYATWHAMYNVGAFAAGDYEDVVARATALLPTYPAYAGLHRQRAASLALLGRVSEARADIDALLRLQPDNSIAQLREQLPWFPNLETFLEGLRLAGLPEG